MSDQPEVDMIDLFGWDTVFGISFTKANAAIKQCKSTPKNFHYDVLGKDGSKLGTIDGQWDDWQLTLQGSGKIITLKCPITQGTFATKAEDWTAFKLDGQWVEVGIKLEYLDQPQATQPDKTAKPGTGTQTNLSPRTRSSDPADPVAYTVASSFNFPGANDPDGAAGDCERYFKDWFNQNLGQFDHVFSALMIDTQALTADYQWLKPTDKGYAVSATDNPDTSVFAVLTMTENRPSAGNHTVDPRLLQVTGNNHAAFAISAPLFVDKWLMKALQTMFLGTKSGDFSKINGGLTLTNNDEISWATFQDNKGKPQLAKIPPKKFMFGVDNDLITVKFQDLYWQSMDEVITSVDYAEYYNLQLKSGTDAKGQAYKNVLSVTAVGKPSLTCSAQVSDAKRWTDLAIEIGAAVGGAIAGGLVGGLFDAAVDGAEAAVEAGVEGAESGGLATTEKVALEDAADLLVDEEEEGIILPREVQQLSDGAAKDTSESLTDDADQIGKGADPKAVGGAEASKPTGFLQKVWQNRWKMVGSIVGGVVGTGIGFIPKIIDTINEKNFSELPTLNAFAANCVGAVQWPGAAEFTLTSASLCGALVLGGDLSESTNGKS